MSTSTDMFRARVHVWGSFLLRNYIVFLTFCSHTHLDCTIWVHVYMCDVTRFVSHPRSINFQHVLISRSSAVRQWVGQSRSRGRSVSLSVRQLRSVSQLLIHSLRHSIALDGCDCGGAQEPHTQNVNVGNFQVLFYLFLLFFCSLPAGMCGGCVGRRE